MPDARRIEYMPLSALTPSPWNPKDHDVGAIVESINVNAFTNAPVWDERLHCLVIGHGRRKALLALQKEGAVPPEGIRVEVGEWLVPVQRGWASRDDAHHRKALLADNQTTILGGWNDASLAETLQKLAAESDLTGTGFDADDLDELLKRLGIDAAKGLTDPDEVPEAPDASACYVQPGDLWQLGEHRLLCGDSNNILDIDRVLDGAKAAALVSDPPYGIDVVGGDNAVGGGKLAKAGRYDRVIGDDEPFDPRPFLPLAPTIVLFGGNHFADKLPPSSGWIVWDKRDGLASNDFADCELAWTNQDRPARLFVHRWSGMLKASEKTERRQHPTQKPVALFHWILESLTDSGQIILDPFLGSGSTLLACEQTGRVAHAIEIEPRYVQVAIERWQKFTGKTAIKLEDHVQVTRAPEPLPAAKPAGKPGTGKPDRKAAHRVRPGSHRGPGKDRGKSGGDGSRARRR